MADLQLFKQVKKLMGNRFEISVVADDEAWANQQIELAIVEIQRIERLLTTFDEGSQTNLINRNAGIAPVQVDKEVFELIERALRISHLTQGAFDLSYGSLDKRFWNFDTQMTQLPDRERAKKSVALINYQNIILNKLNLTVFLKEKEMRIGFGGIGKGYAAGMAKQVLKTNGVKSGIVNASGDLTTWGSQPNGDAWTIAVADPNQRNASFSYMKVSDMAVATSGNYEKFVFIDGRRYAHTIDPHTGFPVSGIKSVTIICPHAELADALTTPILVMGVKVGLNLVNQLRHIGAIIVDDYDKIFTSNNIKLS
jgi:thiamine biosynthesis lipoprotein